MIFLGDIANPGFYNNSNIIGTDGIFVNKFVVANLEGDIHQDLSSLDENIVFNTPDTLDSLSMFNVKLLNLANNHIMDVSQSPQTTIEFLNKNEINSVGAGGNSSEASQPLEITLNNEEFTFFSFGWNVIGCRRPTSKKPGINMYDPIENLREIKKYKTLNQYRKIIVLVHWNYELELYPQPMDRQFAHKLIDIGVEAVIGCHSHCVQGIEIYKEKPIVYSLGNWLFPDGYFFNGKLKFPEISRLQLAFEYNTDKEIICHWFEKQQDNTVEYSFSEKLTNSKKIKELTPFESLTHEEYIKFFKENRRKKAALPIFKDYKSKHENFVKSKYVFIRHKGIRALLLIGLKKGPK